MTTTMTITEALAEIKLLEKRLTANSEFVRNYLYRDNRMKDPFVDDGGANVVIASRRQASHDLRERVIRIRSAINRANQSVELTIANVTRTLADWLTWKREVAPGLKVELDALASQLSQMRAQTRMRGQAVADTAGVGDVVVHISEQELAEQRELLEIILGKLDGLLSHRNATTTIEVGD